MRRARFHHIVDDVEVSKSELDAMPNVNDGDGELESLDVFTSQAAGFVYLEIVDDEFLESGSKGGRAVSADKSGNGSVRCVRLLGCVGTERDLFGFLRRCPASTGSRQQSQPRLNAHVESAHLLAPLQPNDHLLNVLLVIGAVVEDLGEIDVQALRRLSVVTVGGSEPKDAI